MKKRPTEIHNLYVQPGYEKLTHRLHNSLDALQKHYDVRLENF